MTDSEFQASMAMCVEAHGIYLSHLWKIEDEFERRYGYNPSDHDCDSWIDTFHIEPTSVPTVAMVEEWSTYANHRRES